MSAIDAGRGAGKKGKEAKHLSSGLRRLREAARRDKSVQFTALLHHITVNLLRASYRKLNPKAAPGVDGVTWAQYGEGLEERLTDLHGRVHRGSYRAKPSKRIYIPKGEQEMRPLGMAALEDKIVQQATVWVLEQIYEEDFLNFSYGFRPGRSPHNALDALYMGIKVKKVNWILDADIRKFFDTVQFNWIERFVEHRVADRRILRLVKKWLRAGVSKEGEWSQTREGTPQGAVVSPIIANIYLHYVLDMWVRQWRRKHARGDMIVVRYADDVVLGFQHEDDARRFWMELDKRLGRFGLSLNKEKTRLIEFGRYAAERRAERGEGKPETFDFLGFTHISGKSRKNGRFILMRKTARKRLHAKMKEIRRTLLRCRHRPINEQGKWLRLVLQGYFNYYGIPGNGPALKAIRSDVGRAWLKALRRRGQHDKANWEFMKELMAQWLPPIHIVHPYPDERLAV
ncbi:MAG: group II intron reverse transcriptase/maturase [Lentisphaerae bacterium]|nr:group II intron reverse transcriptase/maturase [Lentisphaerota bacterium]